MINRLLLHNSSNEWATIQDNVRRGLGSTLYPVGTQFTTVRDWSPLVWDVVHHCLLGEDKKLYQIGEGVGTPCMILQMHQCFLAALNGVLASMYCETAIPPGEYKIAGMRNDQYDEGGVATYSFTTTTEVPSGGKIHIANGEEGFGYAVPFKTYDRSCNLIESGTATKTSSETATLLGTQWRGYSSGTISSDNFPFQMSCLGNAYWVQSSLREYLNSNATGTGWFTPWRLQVPDWNVTTGLTNGGFLRRVPSDFLAVVSSVNHYTADRDTAFVPIMTPPSTASEISWSTDKFWIPSNLQVGGTTQQGAFDFYLITSNRIKTQLLTSTPVNWRVTMCTGPYLWRTGGVDTSGNVGDKCECAGQNGVAPCCVIA